MYPEIGQYAPGPRMQQDHERHGLIRFHDGRNEVQGRLSIQRPTRSIKSYIAEITKSVNGVITTFRFKGKKIPFDTHFQEEDNSFLMGPVFTKNIKNISRKHN